MCGITGIVSLEGPAGLAEDVRVMTDVIRHRGPDDEGVYVDPDAAVALGHRRLSILDLSPSGHQPMADKRGRYVLSYNGEIYNFRALRARLEAEGCAFEGTSDTEILVEAVARWGVDAALERANGMFATAIWDREARTLHLARDRVGEKPLYYGWIGRRFVFASELSAIRALPGFSLDIDRDALASYLRFSATPGTRSIQRGLFKLEPGGVRRLEVSRARPGDRPPLTRFWSAAEARAAGHASPLSGSPQDAVDGLEALLLDAVELRMESDVPLGAFLSGGIDSSLVTAVMQRIAPRVRTFSIGFDFPGFDESHHARAVAAHLGTEHTELRVSPDDAREVIPRLATIYDEPFADVSQIPTFLVSRMAREHVTVCLSGDGGDELFAGYGRYSHAQRVYDAVSRVPGSLRRPGARALASLSGLLGQVDRGPLAAQRDRLALARRLLATRSATDFYRQLLSVWREDRPVVLGTNPDPARVVGLTPAAALHDGDLIELASYLDVVGYLPDDILVKVDRASMAVGLEVRAPLLDYRVVERAFRMPTALKRRDGRAKWPLTTLVERYLPRAMMDRPKMGFGVPIHEWLRGPLRAWADDLLAPDVLRRAGLLDAELVARRWSEHRAGRRNRAPDVWAVLMFQAWLAAVRS